MTTLKGSKKEGAKIIQTKTWGFHVIDYKNLHEGRPVSSNHGTYNAAEIFFDRIISGEKINYKK